MEPLAYAGRDKGQAILELLGLYSRVEWPLSLYLTDGLVYHRLTLIGKQLICWEDLQPRQALHSMVIELAKVSCKTPGSFVAWHKHFDWCVYVI